MLELLNAMLVKYCTDDNDLAEDLVDEEGEFIVFTSKDISLECFKIFYNKRGQDIIDASDCSGLNDEF